MEYLLPALAHVTLPASPDVRRAILFNSDCTAVLEVAFGDGNNPFTYGGQLWVGPNADEAGVTTDSAQQAGPPASLTKRCAAEENPGVDDTHYPMGSG